MKCSEVSDERIEMQKQQPERRCCRKMPPSRRELTPDLDDETAENVNLVMLQRIDSYVQQILMVATQVAFYDMDMDTRQWIRKEDQGPLFVVKRKNLPRFRFIVMNTLNQDNLVEDIVENFVFKIGPMSLLYRSASQEVKGMLFQDELECKAIGNLFSRITKRHSKGTTSITTAGEGELEELEAFPSLPIVDSALKPSPPAAIVPKNHTGPLILDYFKAATDTLETLDLGQPDHTTPTSDRTTPTSTKSPSVSSSKAAPQMQSIPHATSSQIARHKTLDPLSCSRHSTHRLVKPSFYTPASSPSALVTPSSLSTPKSTGFHTPGSSFTPNERHGFSKEKVRDALLILVQDDRFIDMLCTVLQKVHRSS